MNIEYVADYIQQALTQKEIKEPLPGTANGQTEVLVSLYTAHKMGGISSARMAWETIKAQRPDVAYLEAYRRKLIHADELKQLSKPIYLLDEYPIYLGGFNVLSGPSGAGKSFVALDISGLIAKRGTVVYIAGEGLHGYSSRWEAWKKHHKVSTAELYFYTEALQVMDETQLQPFIEMIRQHNPLMVVIDTLARSAVGLEENSARDMGIFVGACDRIRTQLDTSVLVVHHTGKDGKIRGSSSLYAAADAVIALTGSDGRITIQNSGEFGGKNKHAESAKPRYMQIMPVGDGAVVVPAEKVIEDKSSRLNSRQQTIIDLVFTHDGMTPAQIIEETDLSQATVYRLLKQMVKLGLIEKDDEEFIITQDGKAHV